MLEIANNLSNNSHIVRVKIKLDRSDRTLAKIMLEIDNNLFNISHIVRVIDQT